MQGAEIRERFLRFFEERGHARVRSSSLIPPPETGLLLANAGMNQFIPYFLGQAEPPYPRATSVQKSFRTNDIELVGLTARHCTLFEMLGNFSFGDYFKSEACAYAYELVTEGYGIDAELLWVTVFETDDESVEIWADEVGIPRDRIVKRGSEDNFWWTHAAGPGGPCSEIYVDRGPKYGQEGGPAVDEERHLEIWNLVFMQNDVDDAGEVVGDLPRKNIDTGSGLERVALVLQGKDTYFETDVVWPLLEQAQSLSGKRYGDDHRADISLKIVAEHSRAVTFLIADGVLPSNEGRGYVLRRMLRRVVSHARRLGVDRPVAGALAETAIVMFGDAYPELRENREFILQVAGSEESRFGATLRQGLTLLEEEVGKPEWREHSGDVAFRLHDTFGFPVELTKELAEERGLSVDADRFGELMEQQRQRAQEAVQKGPVGEQAIGDTAARVGRTEFLGYETLNAEARIESLFADGREVESAHEGQDILVLLNRTPFYAEGGGQVGDQGMIRATSGLVRVEDVSPGPGDVIVHRARVTSGEVRLGDQVQAEVDAEFREGAARSHTATHVVHWTLRNLLGEHARQAGSLVQPGRLRFDFTHHQAVPHDVLEEAEYVANARLAEDSPVRAYETTIDYARSEGAIALFGEKYGDIVRVVEVGDYSKELCGGTHVPHTGKVALVKILGEGSIGSGMRRVEALVGPDALRHINAEHQLLLEITAALGGGDPGQAPDRVRRTLERVKQLESELGKIRKGERGTVVDELAAQAQQVDGVRLVVSSIPGEDANGLRELADLLRSKLEREGAAAAVLGTTEGGSARLVASVTKPLITRGVTAKMLLQPAAAAIGGGAGGKPHLGMAGGKNAGALEDALGGIPARLAELLRGGSRGGSGG
ncbi:MAG: alanine--tRNA ligase [Actinomycetota bacterium]